MSKFNPDFTPYRRTTLTPDWTYRLAITPEPDRDATILSVVRYRTYPKDTSQSVYPPVQQYLTTTGWRPFHEYEFLADQVVIPGWCLLKPELAFKAALAAMKQALDLPEPCPRDTDGDGNCGSWHCPVCGPIRPKPETAP